MENQNGRGNLRKGWIVVIPNYTKDDEDLFKNEKFIYSIFGREKCPTTGTPHLQGYVHFLRKKRFTAVKKIFVKAHLEPAEGNAQQNKIYSSKDGDFVEYGDCPLDGPATIKKDWDLAKSQAITGNIKDIQASIYIPHYHTLHAIANDHKPKPSSRPLLIDEWHYGPTGCGKSRPLRERYPDAFIKDADKWWDGYEGEEIVIIEDIDKYDVALGRYIKLWCDHYPFPAHYKHKGSRLARPKQVFFTSNYKPSEIWSDEKTFLPIERRVKLINHGLRDTTTLTQQVHYGPNYYEYDLQYV